VNVESGSVKAEIGSVKAESGSVKVEITSLGRWGGARLLAEYDPEDDAIRIDADAVERVRRALGDAEAARFVRYAVAHERYHREHPRATEAQAHAFARVVSGADPRDFEAVLRGGVGGTCPRLV
jgi:hypothetical protein